MKTLESSDSGKPVRLVTGEALALDLRETPTTGFRWSVTQLPPFLRLVADSFDAPSPKFSGAPGYHHWIFQADCAGTGELRLELKARTRSSSQPDVFTANVEVADS